MGVYKKSAFTLLYLLRFLNVPSEAEPTQKVYFEKRVLGNIRSRRQEGYVYDRPSVSFDLPTPISTTVTQAPVSDVTQLQYMYYAYPAPSGDTGDTLNIGYSMSTKTTTSPSAVGTKGYNYGTIATNSEANNLRTFANTGATGYNYGISTSNSEINNGVANSDTSNADYNYGVSALNSVTNGLGTSTNIGAAGYNYGTTASKPDSNNAEISSATGVTGYNYRTQTSVTTNMQGKTGACTIEYNCNSPVSNGIPDISSTVSTNAPKYLPPIDGDGVVETGISTNVPPNPVPTIAAPFQAVTTASTAATDDSYLPPNAVPSISAGRQSKVSSGTASVPPATSSTGYLPPVSLPSSQASTTVSTPASTYLPPVF